MKNKSTHQRSSTSPSGIDKKRSTRRQKIEQLRGKENLEGNKNSDFSQVKDTQ